MRFVLCLCFFSAILVGCGGAGSSDPIAPANTAPLPPEDEPMGAGGKTDPSLTPPPLPAP